MTELRVPEVPEDIHRALCARAARNGRSAEAEARAILQDAVQPDLAESMPDNGLSIVGAIAAAAREAGLTNEDVEIIEQAIAEQRAEARKHYKPVSFE